VIGGFYIGEHYCILHALRNKKENLAVFNLADFHNSSNRQNKFYAKFSFYMVNNILVVISSVTTERSPSSSSNSSIDRHSTVLENPYALKKKDSSLGGQQQPTQSTGEGAKEEGGVGTVLNNSFKTVTLTVQAFFKQVCKHV